MDEKEKLEWLLNYEINLASRYRHFLSLVFLTPTGDQGVDVESLLDSSLRDCDEFFHLEDSSAILMAHTGMPEAQEAIDRIKHMCNGTIDLRYSVSAYPEETTVGEMIDAAVHRLNLAKNREYGAVVFNG
jgi:hypothetical protein